MNAIDELVEIIRNFTPDQLNKFLNDPVTVSTLQPVEASESCLQGVS